MTDTPEILSAFDAARLRRRKRRAAKLEMRDTCFQAMADGFTQEQIATARGVSVATIRREIDRALAARQVRGVEAHVRLQIARATKALALLDMRISAGETAAVGPYLKTLAALDRYHGLDASFVPPASEPARRTPPSLPAPPLALTHAAAALAPPVPETADAGCDDA